MILTILDSVKHRSREARTITIVIILTILCMACGTEGSDAKLISAGDIPKEQSKDLIENDTETEKTDEKSVDNDTETEKADEKSIEDDVQEEQEIQKTEPDMTEEFDQIMKCLDEQVPEIFDEWNDYVVEKSEGKAHMMEMMAGGYELEDVYRDYAKTEYLGKYYCVYVGESWDDHCVNWEYFYVSEDFDEVLWYDFIPLMDSDYCVFYLDEWRNSEWYPKLGE